MMIVNGLLDRGFSVSTYDVETTHGELGSAPSSFTIDGMQAFTEQLRVINPGIVRAIHDSDLVVVNGEGTLHHFHNAPRALLSLIWMTKHYAQKPIHLINHSCFPSGDCGPGDANAEEFYRNCLSLVDRVVVRENWSREVYKRFSINYEEGFDCLPLYAARYLKPLPKFPTCVVLGAASHWTSETALTVGRALHDADVTAQSDSLVFLSGGYRRSPSEDSLHYEILKSVLPTLKMVSPVQLDEWLGWIASAALLVTGRFHHIVSAAAFSTPIIAFPGNTAKNQAICDMLSFPKPLDPEDMHLTDHLRLALRSPSRTSSRQVNTLLTRAKNNLEF